MNLVSGFNTKKEIYNKELNLIEGIKFTYREIDIISCIKLTPCSVGFSGLKGLYILQSVSLILSFLPNSLFK